MDLSGREEEEEEKETATARGKREGGRERDDEMGFLPPLCKDQNNSAQERKTFDFSSLFWRS